MQICSQTSLAAQSDAAAAARAADQIDRRRGGAGEPCGRGWAGGPWVSVSVPVCGVELRPEVLKCMSASAGSGLVRTTTTAAAVVLKRTAPERLAAAVATLTPRRPGPAAPARRHLGPGGGAPAAASPARAPGRCGAGPGARRQSRRVYTPDGGFSPIPFSTSSIRSSSITTAQGESASARVVSGGGGESGGPVSSRPAQIYSLPPMFPRHHSKNHALPTRTLLRTLLPATKPPPPPPCAGTPLFQRLPVRALPSPEPSST